jgi:hypothetical protein
MTSDGCALARWQTATPHVGRAPQGCDQAVHFTLIELTEDGRRPRKIGYNAGDFTFCNFSCGSVRHNADYYQLL